MRGTLSLTKHGQRKGEAAIKNQKHKEKGALKTQNIANKQLKSCLRNTFHKQLTKINS